MRGQTPNQCEIASNVCALEDRDLYDFIPPRPRATKGIGGQPDLAWDTCRDRLYLAYTQKPVLEEFSLRINAGGCRVFAKGPADEHAVEWRDDDSFLGVPPGMELAVPEQQPPQDPDPPPAPPDVYESVRHGSHEFDIDSTAVPDGTYDVRVHFSSPSGLAPQLFDYFIEGLQVLDDYDPEVAAGRKDKVIIEVFENVVVTNGLQIRCVPVGGNECSELAIDVVGPEGEIHDTNIWVTSSAGPDYDVWTTPVLVNADEPAGDTQFFQRIAVDQRTGNVAVAWYDTRAQGDPSKVRIFAALSTNQGACFGPNSAISDGVSDGDPGGAGMQSTLGDYLGLAFDNDELFPVWADNSPGHSGPSGEYGSELVTQRVEASELGGCAQP